MVAAQLAPRPPRGRRPASRPATDSVEVVAAVTLRPARRASVAGPVQLAGLVEVAVHRVQLGEHRRGSTASAWRSPRTWTSSVSQRSQHVGRRHRAAQARRSRSPPRRARPAARSPARVACVTRPLGGVGRRLVVAARRRRRPSAGGRRAPARPGRRRPRTSLWASRDARARCVGLVARRCPAKMSMADPGRARPRGRAGHRRSARRRQRVVGGDDRLGELAALHERLAESDGQLDPGRVVARAAGRRLDASRSMPPPACRRARMRAARRRRACVAARAPRSRPSSSSGPSSVR